jgi:hypothetical protein
MEAGEYLDKLGEYTLLLIELIVSSASFIYLYTLLTISLDCECNTFPLNLLRVGGMIKEI